MALVLELGTEPTRRKSPVNGEAQFSAEMMGTDNAETMEVDELDEPDGVELSDKDLQFGHGHCQAATDSSKHRKYRQQSNYESLLYCVCVWLHITCVQGGRQRKSVLLAAGLTHIVWQASFRSPRGRYSEVEAGLGRQ